MSEETNTPTITPPQRQSPANSLGVPIAIVIAAALIAGAIYVSGTQNGPTGTNSIPDPNAQVTPDTEVAPVTNDDHIRGNPNAPIMIVEYSDYDCPFCKNFHETMKQVMAKYGTDGQVAWVYRQFPLESLHPNAPKIAGASECVAELGGNEAFWAFSDLVFGERSTNEPTDLTRLPEFATTAGVDKTAFENCYNSGKYTEQIAADIEAALAAGARGTPYSIVMVGDQQGVINGAQQYPVVEQIIETLIDQVEAPQS